MLASRSQITKIPGQYGPSLRPDDYYGQGYVEGQ